MRDRMWIARRVDIARHAASQLPPA
jgi:hypothetical protein